MAHYRGRSVGGIPTPNRGCRRHNGTSPDLKSTSPPAVADDAHKQVYRMFHIYDRNPFMCIIPLITIAALFCEFFSPLRPTVCLSRLSAIS